MCDFSGKKSGPTSPVPTSPAVSLIASANNSEAIKQSDMEARLRARRGGAAAHILTGPRGIPATDHLGRVAA